MNSETCDLCKKALRRSIESLLCQDCTDAIARVVAFQINEANCSKGDQAQLAQARRLLKASRIWAWGQSLGSD